MVLYFERASLLRMLNFTKPRHKGSGCARAGAAEAADSTNGRERRQFRGGFISTSTRSVRGKHDQQPQGGIKTPDNFSKLETQTSDRVFEQRSDALPLDR